MSRNGALERVGRAKVAYALQQRGWRVGEAYDDGYDILAFHPATGTTACIELKTMDIGNRTPEGNLTAPVSPTERKTCTHIVVYVEPHGWYFIARKDRVITDKGNIYAALNRDRQLRVPKDGSKSFARYQDAWEELLT